MKFYFSIIVVLAVILIGGCASIRVTDPPKTATEQFLLSHAAIKAVDSLSFDSLFGTKVFVDSTHFAPADKEFILGEFRARLLSSGVQVMDGLEKADIVVEVRSGGVGIDRYENLIGVPSIAAPAGAGAAGADGLGSTLITPELAITKKIKQVAFASIAYVAYHRQTGEIIAQSGPTLGNAYREDWWFIGIGPKSVGTIPPVNHKTETLE